MSKVGIIIFIFGATLADSENIYVPMAFLFVGLALIAWGLKNEKDD